MNFEIIFQKHKILDKLLQLNFNEFCFRINRSQNKNKIFNNLITKMVNSNVIYQSQLISN